jgi:hypothetical protein
MAMKKKQLEDMLFDMIRTVDHCGRIDWNRVDFVLQDEVGTDAWKWYQDQLKKRSKKNK